MQYPYLQEVTRYREMTSAFGGYNHQLSCQEGQFYDMQNMTSQYYPILSPRNSRGIVRQLTTPQGILDKEQLMWIDNDKLYINGVEILQLENTVDLGHGWEWTEGRRTMTKMGAFVVIMPDKVWYNTETGEHGKMEATFNGSTVSFYNCDVHGNEIRVRSQDYYEQNGASSGDYVITEANGEISCKVYSEITNSWTNATLPRVEICCTGIGREFEIGDAVKISLTMTIENWEDYVNLYGIFVNEDYKAGETYKELMKRHTNAVIVDKTKDSITIGGVAVTYARDVDASFPDASITVERTVPTMQYITECNNRLWGCSPDGHEIYCCKLGDVKNWNVFQGISTDSWTATIGSDGKFTGATTYLGYPIFFKEDSLIKISISGTGGHQIKETKCRGVQSGSDRSLAILNETLYYKSPSGVCMYTGSLPVGISDELGEVRYYGAVAGTIGDRYYISMKDSKEEAHLFVYDTKNGIWCKEDGTEALYFCRYNSELYYIDVADKCMKSVNGTMLYGTSEAEGPLEWFAESGNIGYSSPDNKYVSKINLRISLEFGTNVDFYLQYDSCGEWEHKFNMSGKGTRTFTVPIIPKRCDHFKYKIVGKGGCKIHSITKTMEQGSDV